MSMERDLDKALNYSMTPEAFVSRGVTDLAIQEILIFCFSNLNICQISSSMVTAKNTKKRPASTKLESKPKKRSTAEEPPEVTLKSTEKKRSRPVTHAFPIVEESDSESWGGVDDGGGSDDDGATGDEPLLDEDAMDVDEVAKTKVQKDPNGELF